ncbi:MAG: RDD family protein [Cyclobacteriaceae bacterium]
MPSIDIKTPQHVTIDYQLASWGERILAYVIDFAIMVGSSLLLALLLAKLIGFSNTVFIVTYGVIFGLYTLLFETSLKGQTLGKKALKIRVVDLHAEPVTLTAYVLRWSFRFIDIYFSLGVLASVLMNTTLKAQRLGDILANTVVIKERESDPLKLENMEAILNESEHTITYPDVVRFSEEEMLFAKKTLDRVKKHPNDSHKKALVLLTDKLMERLEITPSTGSKEQFIKTVIKDYIQLTR